MKTIGYVRVSTSGQVQDGVSLSAQESKIRAWAELNGAEDVVIFTDAGLSGKRADNRPALQDALKTVGKGDALVVYSLSRLAQSTKDTISIAETLDKRGADLVSLSEKIDTTTAGGKMVFRMLAVLSEFERDQVSERTRVALAYKRANGEKTGGDVPFGYKLKAGRLVPHESEQEAIALIRELRGMNRAKKRQDSVTFRPMGNNSPDPEADNLADEPEMKALSKMINAGEVSRDRALDYLEGEF